jgi:hypothetical protein
MPKKIKNINKKKKFWWIYNQEESPVAVCYARTKGGALARFEEASGLNRQSFRAEIFTFEDGCSLGNINT